MTLREYTRINSINTLLNGKTYNFKEIFSFYESFKKFGKKLCKELVFDPIIISLDTNTIDLQWPLFKIDKVNNYTYFIPDNIEDYLNQIESDISSDEIYSLAILIGEISRILHFYNYYGIDCVDDIKSKVFKIVNSINLINPIAFQYDDVNEFKNLFKNIETINPKINLVKEDLITEDDYIKTNINFLNLISLIMHFIKVEIMYYTSFNKSGYKPKKCVDCHIIFIGKGPKCKSCSKITAATRRNINKKCDILRKKIEKKKELYKKVLPDTIINEANILLKEEHKYTQYKKLEEFYEKISNYTIKKS